MITVTKPSLETSPAVVQTVLPIVFKLRLPCLPSLVRAAVLLSYLTKAPLVPPSTPVVNALAKQRAMLENIMRACVGLPPDNNMMMEFKC